MPKLHDDTPRALGPYVFHGVDCSSTVGDQVVAECPFCGKSKWFCSVETGLWNCKVCGASGNSILFLRQLWEVSEASPGHLKVLAADRTLVDHETLSLWGVRRSAITSQWIVPGYDDRREISTLYRYAGRPKPLLLVTKDHPHGLLGLPLFDDEYEDVYLCETWNAPALWEVVRHAGIPANVVGVPGANAFYDSWAAMFKDRRVTLAFDNDHRRRVDGRDVDGAGLLGTKRVTGLLAGVAKEVYWLRWGPDGYDPSLPSGYDVRDILADGGNFDIDLRVRLYQDQILTRLAAVPREWIEEGKKARAAADMGPLFCDDWKTVILAWRKAMKWRQDLDDVLSVMLAVCLSTDQEGDSQLFLQVIGSAGGGKTKLCDALLISKSCYPLEHLTGFHSGYQGPEGDKEDYSLIARMNHKTLITPEGDVLMSSPRFTEIMSQQRRIFDGTSGASYKTMKTDRRYEGLRTPWIMAGTLALLSTDQSRLGDRFLRIIITDPSTDERREILRRVAFSAMRSVVVKSNCSAASIISPELRLAYRLTGGYVDHLRGRSQELLRSVSVDGEWVADRCAALGEFTAMYRARPDADKRKDEKHDTKELPTRLTAQYVRLATCLAVVLDRGTIDEEVMRRVRKVAIDTAQGITARIAGVLAPEGVRGLSLGMVAGKIQETDDVTKKYLLFLRALGAVESWAAKGPGTTVRYRLRPDALALYCEIMGVAPSAELDLSASESGEPDEESAPPSLWGD